MTRYTHEINNVMIKISNFIINRFPFWDAFSTAMLLAEFEEKNRLFSTI